MSGSVRAMAPSSPAVADVSAVELQVWFSEGRDVRLLDVRSPAEYETAHIDGAVNIPVHELDGVMSELRDVGAELVVVCHSGAGATRACEQMLRGGVTGLRLLQGGVSAWEQSGGSLNRGRQRWSLERQVRLVAGGIVATSILVSLRRPRARFVAGAVGAGLTFAAVSNTCAMGSVLARLPYNRLTRTMSPVETARRLHVSGTGARS